MTNSLKNFSLSLFFFLIMVFFAFPLAVQAEADLNPLPAIFSPQSYITESEIDKIISSDQMQIRIPGLKFSSPEDVQKLITEEEGGTYLFIPFLGEYLAAAYKYTVVVTSIIAVILIMNHGFGLVVSGGIPEKVQHAKTRIMQAVVGLLIAVGSYVLLYTINPNLVEFKNLKVLYVKGIPLEGPGEDESKITAIQTAPTVEKDIISATNQCFPVKSGSFDKISWNWGGARANGSRCHAGIDLYTKSPGEVVAADDGVVTNVSKTFLKCKDGWGGEGQTGAVFIYHESMGITILYGEIDTDKIKVKIGNKVKKGQFLGVASYCSMLHLETYKGKQSSNSKWMPPDGQTSSLPPPNKCAQQFLNTRPQNLLDPTDLIQKIKNNNCP